jgi:hypothetical protein
LTPAGRLRAADPEALAAIGLRPDDFNAILKRGFGWIELPRAAALARLLSGSIAWLAGAEAEPGEPPAPGRIELDSAAVRRLRRDRGLPERGILDAVGLTANDWRRLLDGRDAPTLEQLAELAGLLATPIPYLVIDSEVAA